jgi:hypothetical protein
LAARKAVGMCQWKWLRGSIPRNPTSPDLKTAEPSTNANQRIAKATGDPLVIMITHTAWRHVV